MRLRQISPIEAIQAVCAYNTGLEEGSIGFAVMDEEMIFVKVRSDYIEQAGDLIKIFIAKLSVEIVIVIANIPIVPLFQ